MTDDEQQLTSPSARRSSYESLLRLAWRLNQEFQIEEALAVCDRAAAQAPTVLLAIAAYEAKAGLFAWPSLEYRDIISQAAYEQALALCEQALRESPRDLELWRKKRYILDMLGREAESLAACDALIQLAPDDLESYFGKGLTLFSFKRANAGRVFYAELLRRFPHNTAVYRSFALSLELACYFEEALEVCEQALAIRADEAETYARKAGILFELWRYQDSLAATEEALRLDPDNPMYIRNKAHCQSYLSERQ